VYVKFEFVLLVSKERVARKKRGTKHDATAGVVLHAEHSRRGGVEQERSTE
jgi:hypothetical protein